MSRVLFGINIRDLGNIRDLDLLHLTVTIFPWPLTLIFDHETYLLLPWCFEENITKMYCFDVTWRKNGSWYVRTETNLSISILSVNILQPTRSLYDFRFQSYGSKCDFHGFWCVWPWPWQFKVILFLCVYHMPLHDWCDFRRDMFIISGDIAHWNMEKLPILHNGIFRCHGNVRYIFLIDAIFGRVHNIGPCNMCINFEKNRLRIDDFRKSEKIVCFLWRHVAQ